MFYACHPNPNPNPNGYVNKVSIIVKICKEVLENRGFTMPSVSTCFTVKHSAPTRYSKNPSLLRLKPSQFHPLIPFKSHHANVRLKLQPSTRGGILPVIRASNNFNDLKPGRIIESDKLAADVRKCTIDAVDACGRRVTAGDVSRTTGIKLSEAQKALQALAADTNGFLEVSDEGDVLFVFSKDYRANLATKSLVLKMQPLVEEVKSAVEYMVKISIGTTLVASIVIVCATIICIIVLAVVGSANDDEEISDGSKGRKSSGSSISACNDIDMSWYYDWANSIPKTKDPVIQKNQKQGSSGPIFFQEIGFFEAIFSFVLGDGDPNKGIEEKRWRLISQYIGSKGGVVTGEELAPYLDLDTTAPRKNMVGHDSSNYTLPVLLKFDGQPVVDGEGNILYQFPSLQHTAGRPTDETIGGIEKFLVEKMWQFSRISAVDRAAVISLGGLNLFVVAILRTLLKNMTIKPNRFISFVSRIFPLLQIYAASIFAIPLVRWFFIWKMNSEIEKRDRARKECAQALESPDPSLRMKLLSARDMSKRTIIGQDRIVYSTERDLDEQDYHTKEWDQRFQIIT